MNALNGYSEDIKFLAFELYDKLIRTNLPIKYIGILEREFVNFLKLKEAESYDGELDISEKDIFFYQQQLRAFLMDLSTDEKLVSAFEDQNWDFDIFQRTYGKIHLN